MAILLVFAVFEVLDKPDLLLAYRLCLVVVVTSEEAVARSLGYGFAVVGVVRRAADWSMVVAFSLVEAVKSKAGES